MFSHPEFEVWNKPSGMSTHNEPPSLLAEIQKRRPGPVNFLNRLDVETSGLVVTVRDAARMKAYQELWGLDSTRKIYAGLHRRPRDFALGERTWAWPLTDKAEGRQNPQGLAKDRLECRTVCVPLLETRHLVLTALILESGRQHQIRKHAAIAGLELIGDTRYGDPKYLGTLRARIPDLRLGLHAGALLWGPGAARAELPDFFEAQISGARAAFADFVKIKEI